jgi:hypothetical protein
MMLTNVCRRSHKASVAAAGHTRTTRLGEGHASIFYFVMIRPRTTDHNFCVPVRRRATFGTPNLSRVGLLDGGLVILAFAKMRESMEEIDRSAPQPSALKADCSKCAALCCVAPAFYAIQGFGFDKPAHTPCRHLSHANRCAIHAQLDSHGFHGCSGFDCYGAGQRVTQDLFVGENWRESQRTAAAIFRAYATCLALHKLMAILALAEAALTEPFAAPLRAHRALLDERCSSDEAKAGTLDLAAIEAETLGIVREAVRLISRPYPSSVVQSPGARDSGAVAAQYVARPPEQS